MSGTRQEPRCRGAAGRSSTSAGRDSSRHRRRPCTRTSSSRRRSPRPAGEAHREYRRRRASVSVTREEVGLDVVHRRPRLADEHEASGHRLLQLETRAWRASMSVKTLVPGCASKAGRRPAHVYESTVSRPAKGLSSFFRVPSIDVCIGASQGIATMGIPGKRTARNFAPLPCGDEASLINLRHGRPSLGSDDHEMTRRTNSSTNCSRGPYRRRRTARTYFHEHQGFRN